MRFSLLYTQPSHAFNCSASVFISTIRLPSRQHNQLVPGFVSFWSASVWSTSVSPTFLSNSFKRSEHFFRQHISPSFKNGIIRLEGGAFKFLRNQLFMRSMQLPRKRDVPSSAISKMSRSLLRRCENNMQYSAK